jgi:hypothetical protein
MAYWGKRKLPIANDKPPYSIGDGENSYFPAIEIKKSEASYSRNTSSRNYPALSVCPGRANAFTVIPVPNAMGVRANQYPHFLDATVWKRWDGAALQNVQTTLTSARGRFVDFVTEAKVYTVLMNGTDKLAWDGTTVIDLTEAPATRFVTVDDYRLYALLGNTIYNSAEGSVEHWDTGLYPMDANKISVTSMLGAGSAILASNDVVLVWSEQSMHTLFGNDPYDQEFGPDYSDGCISDYSVIELNGNVYFLDFGAYKAYGGGKPVEISQKVKKYLDGINLTYKAKCVAGASGKYIYLAVPYQSTDNNLILEFDTENGTWYPQTGNVIDFINIGESLYGITSPGQPLLLNSGTNFSGAAIPWEHISGIIFDGVFQKKVVSDINAIIDLQAESTLTVSACTSISAGVFDTLYTFTANTEMQNVQIKIPTSKLQNIDWYKLKFAGTGPCTIYFIGSNTRIKER